MKISKEVLKKLRLKKPARPPAPPKPACAKVLGAMSRFHEHLEDGTCITRNWSNSEVGPWRKR